MKLKTFLAAVGRYWKTFVVVTGVVFALGLTWILLTPAKFVSTTQLMVSIQGSTTAAAYQNDEVVAGRVNSYIALLTSDVVSQRVIDKLGLSMTAPELAAKVSATNVPPKTAVIDVAVTDESPARARLLATHSQTSSSATPTRWRRRPARTARRCTPPSSASRASRASVALSVSFSGCSRRSPPCCWERSRCGSDR